MSIDPQVQGILDQLAAAGGKSFEEMTVAEARETVEMFQQLQGEPEDVAEVTDRNIPGPRGDIPVRIYVPQGEGPFPVMVHFHGGGFVIGTLATADRPSRMLANRCGCVVVSVDYRMAPEDPYPASGEDCYAATVWASENAESIGGRSGPVAVVGDSAGGNLAAVVSLMARDKGGPEIGFQFLIYPVTNSRDDLPSRSENGEGYLLTQAGMQWFEDHYTPDRSVLDEAYCCPLLADDLTNLPPALVITAGFDPLRDEGDAYAEALKAAGNEVRHEKNPTMIHGFMWMAGAVDHVAGVFDMAGEHTRKVLSGAAA